RSTFIHHCPPSPTLSPYTTLFRSPEIVAVHVDEPDHLVVGRSSSAAKKAEAFFRISLARRASASSRRSLRFSSLRLSAVGAAGLALPAAMAWLHQARRVSGPQPSDWATTRVEAARGPPSEAWRSKTIRTARSRNSGVNFLGMI